MALSAADANAAADRARKALSNLRAKMATGQEHLYTAAGAGGHELIGYAGLSSTAWASGYWGSDFLTFWNIDFRPVLGAALQLAGLVALVFGMPVGRYGLSVGRGPFAAWLAERSYGMGASARQPSTGARGSLVDTGHPMHRDVEVTRSLQYA